LTEEVWNTPSPGRPQQPGLQRNTHTGAITGNILKHLQGACGISGESFADHSADMMSGIHLDHIDPRTKTDDPCFLLRSHFGRNPAIIKELRGLRAVKSEHHDFGQKASGKLRPVRQAGQKKGASKRKRKRM